MKLSSSYHPDTQTGISHGKFYILLDVINDGTLLVNICNYIWKLVNPVYLFFVAYGKLTTELWPFLFITTPK